MDTSSPSPEELSAIPAVLATKPPDGNYPIDRTRLTPTQAIEIISPFLDGKHEVLREPELAVLHRLLTLISKNPEGVRYSRLYVNGLNEGSKQTQQYKKLTGPINKLFAKKHLRHFYERKKKYLWAGFWCDRDLPGGDTDPLIVLVWQNRKRVQRRGSPPSAR